VIELAVDLGEAGDLEVVAACLEKGAVLLRFCEALVRHGDVQCALRVRFSTQKYALKGGLKSCFWK